MGLAVGARLELVPIARPEIVSEQISNDGTRKWLLQTSDGHEFEMVFIPDADRGTLCVSSQVGCTLNCRFCHTGTMRLVRNLTPGEIVGQVMLARDALGEWPKGKMDFADEESETEYRADGRLLLVAHSARKQDLAFAVRRRDPQPALSSAKISVLAALETDAQEKRQRLVVARVDVADHAHAGVGAKDSGQATRGSGKSPS
mgnify:CR=1 FL=1